MITYPREQPSLYFKIRKTYLPFWFIALSVSCFGEVPSEAAAQVSLCHSALSSQNFHRRSQEKEIGLAKAKHLYMVLDLSGNAIQLKAQGIMLREFPFESWSWLGDAMSDLAEFSFEEKLPSVEPPVTFPSDPLKKPRSLNTEINPLTVADMPYRYMVRWNRDFSMGIESIQKDSLWSQVFDGTATWARRLGIRASNWGGSLLGLSPHDLVIRMAAADAQALHWALVTPMKILLIPKSC